MAASHQAYTTTISSSTSSAGRSSFLPCIHRNKSSRGLLLYSHVPRMKWHQRRPAEVRPFLVLPLLDGERSASAEPSVSVQVRNTSSGSTGTWPPKLKLKTTKKKRKKESDVERPGTATLERPELLNISLLNKIDMSLVRKEFLCITNLCKVALVSKGGSLKGKSTPPAICMTPSEKLKRIRKPETSEDSLESDENNSVRRSRRKINKLVPAVKVKQNKNDENYLAKPSPTNQNRSLVRLKNNPLVSAKQPDETPASKLPEPCKTCGRPDAPERFHSHPSTPLAPRLSPRKTQQPKNTVQKPVAIKYKSPQKSNPPVMSKGTDNAMHSHGDEIKEAKERKGPKTLICYLCGREFGTKSLPLHEPKCLEKWERENNNLPRHLQRKAPVKPDKPLTPEQWNKFAWEASQAALAPCANCGRTFLPDRLIVHQKSCKPNAHHRPPPTQSVSRGPSGDLALNSMAKSPPAGTVECYICGRMFGSRSIGIHEPQCLRKWHAQNNLLPLAQRKSPPVKSNEETTEAETKTNSTSNNAGPSCPSEPRKPMLPCYICGREYGTSSIYIHEPQCLKKWRQENEKLPPAQRRKEPQRPDIKFTPSGQVDYEATNEALWQSHLSQLIPCKICSRTFIPDRVAVHERSCKKQ